MSTANTNKLKVKDIITVVLLSLINVVIFFASSLLYATPVTIILMPVFFSLLEGVIYFIIGTKVKKPGAILIYSIVRAIMGGYLPYIILFIVSGIIGELILHKAGYGNGKALTVSYIITQVLAAFGSTIIPYGIAAKAMADQMVTDGRQDNILAAPIFCSHGYLSRSLPVLSLPPLSERLSAKKSLKSTLRLNRRKTNEQIHRTKALHGFLAYGACGKKTR